MEKTRSLKHRLISALLVLVMTISSLVSTTFAWFTDEVTSMGNTIESGSLKVDLLHKVGADWVSLKDKPEHKVFDYDKWEPGFTLVETLKVQNLGSLALKYRLSVEVEAGTAKLGENRENLADVIDVWVYYGETSVSDYSAITATDSGWVKKGTLSEAMKNPSQFISGNLLPTGKVSNDPNVAVGNTVVNIALHMQESAGNEYQGLSVGDIYVNLLATQLSSESDSFGNDYDNDAEFPSFSGSYIASAPVELDGENRAVNDVILLSEDGTIGAFVPAGTLLKPGTTKLTLNVTTLDKSESNIVASENQNLNSIDVHVNEVAEGNTTPIIVTINKLLEPGLNMGNYELYHVEDGVTVPMTHVVSSAELDVHNEFTYDPATGDVNVAMASFSEVATLADKESTWEGGYDYTWYDANATELKIANADQLAGLSAIVGGMAKIDGNGVIYTSTGVDENVTILQDGFKGKTVKLIADINIGDTNEYYDDASENGIVFYPIGYWNSDETYERTNNAISSGFYSFEGTFDGNGNTISNFYQNTWEMKGDHNWYDATLQYYRDGMGLFGKIYGGTVKNLTVDNFSSDGEITTTGTIAAYAEGATFENIAIFNCNPRVYNIGNGGIVGCVGWYAKDADLKTTFTNITVDNSNKISALWGSYDVACGGIVGQYYPTSGQSAAEYPVNAGIHFENCHVSAQMDVYNDVCANYQYYAYRYTGMFIGSIRENLPADANGHVYPNMNGITASGCTVHFGDWNDYYYCELVANSLASYTHDHQMSRLEQVASVDVENKTVTDLEGKTTAIPTSGRVNYVVVKSKDANSGKWIHGDGHDYAECYHFVNGVQHKHDVADTDNPNPTEMVNGVETLKEDKQLIYREFNQLFTGYGWGVTSKGIEDVKNYVDDEGNKILDITILDRLEGNSVEKFEGKVSELSADKEYKLGNIFDFVDNGVKLVPGALSVGITNLNENNPVSATIDYDRNNWENSTITFTGAGDITITVQDYYFCTPTIINVSIIDREPEVKFDVVMNNGDFLHRVGNSGTVAIDKLFKAKDGVTVGTVDVTVEAVDGTGASGTYSNNAIQFSGTGVVKVTITDNDYCTPTELYLEVVDATNVTSATSATDKNIVLLNDCGFSSLEVSGGYTLYGNGFTLTCSSDSYAKDRTYSFVELAGGTIDNVKIVAPNFSHAIMYEKNKSENNNDTDGDGRYKNIRSAIVVKATSNITNSYISGGRAAIYLTSGELTVQNSTIYGGAVANIQTEASSHLILEDVTLIQEPIEANVNDTNKTVMGFSVVIMCDTSGNGSPVTLKGYLHQYAWAHEGYTQYVPSDGQSAVTQALNQSDFIHSITYSDGATEDSVNLGFVYMPDGTTATNANNMKDERSDSEKSKYLYDEATVSGVATIYTYKNTNGTDDAVKTKPTYTSTTQGIVIPNVQYSGTNENRVFTTTYDATEALWKSTLKVDVDAGAYTFGFDKLLVQKYGNNLSYVIKTADGTVVANNTAITLNSAVSNVYYLTITDNQIYDKNGNLTGETVEITYIFELQSTKTSLPAPTWTSTTLSGTPYIVCDTKNSDWNVAVPVLDGLKIKYWSKKQNKEVELDLATVVSAAGLSNGLQNGSNNTITITVADEYTLTITTSGFKTNDNGKPVVVEGKLYFTVSSSSNYVSTSTTSRTPSITYSFTDANNSDPLPLSTSFTVTYADHKSIQYKYSDFCNGTLTEATTCLVEDTLITLADGTQKRIDQLTYSDELLVWDFYTGKLTIAPISIIYSHEEEIQSVLHLNFSDGTTVKVISSHGFFDTSVNNFVYISENNVTEFIGHSFVKINGDICEKVTLESYNVMDELTTAYWVQTAVHNNAVAEGMLSITTPDYEGWFDYFEITDDMKYDEEHMESEIEKYGLTTYEELAQYGTYEQYVAWNCKYFNILIGRGVVTMEDILWLLECYG